MNADKSPAKKFFPPLHQDQSERNEEIDSPLSSSSDLSLYSGTTASLPLWNNVDTLSMPENTKSSPISTSLLSTPMTSSATLPSTSTTPTTSSHSSFIPTSNYSTATIGTHNITSNESHISTTTTTSPSEDNSAFNISWGGGQDRPPSALHPKQPMPPVLPSKPLPKPRGIRKLPEPEPSEDGTLDEDTLKRRKNTTAARKSRLKKLMHIENLEHQIQQFQAENSQLVLNNAMLESEKKSLLAKEQEYKKRIKYLEDIVRMSCSRVLDESGDLSQR
ncbi:uncharacterized protein BX664DRAFT_388944 [Halteromyces radiatus]|uniref:uncharacterized protein n=1 Tax=Halteromyces radiatus TaxID=101107 RepID=UPI00221F4D4A|nr:uncharacterized protein BX664DRAFT_388944 [Halteromyces radiatus]KAI8079996.1 hypothetical protein BX664DRAFT_388944 [Halteromyces radiatus]